MNLELILYWFLMWMKETCMLTIRLFKMAYTALLAESMTDVDPFIRKWTKECSNNTTSDKVVQIMIFNRTPTAVFTDYTYQHTILLLSGSHRNYIMRTLFRCAGYIGI